MKLSATSGTQGSMRLHPGWMVVSLLCACSAAPLEEDGGSDAGAPAASTVDGGGRDAGVGAGVPERVIFAFDGYPSMAERDPTGQRAVALRAALDALPQTPSTSVAVMSFVGSVTAVFNPNGLIEFTPITSFSSAQRDDAVARLLAFQYPGVSDAGVYRDFVKPLSDVYALIYRETMEALTLGQPPARYTVIFLSDGSPEHQDDQLLCGDAVARLRWLAASAVDVRMHTVHLHLPTTPIDPTCSADAGLTPGSSCALPTVTNPVCPIVEVDLDAARLSRMATLGGGQSLDFRGGTVTLTGLVPR